MIVTHLTPGAAASKAGVRRGDRISQINGEAVDTADQTIQRISNARYRGRATIRLRRDGKELDAVLDLGPPVQYVVTSADDQAAARHFLDLGALYQKANADLQEGITTPYLLQDEFYSGRVLRVFPDAPKPGQAVVVFSTPGDYQKDGKKYAGASVLWENKAQVNALQPGQVTYFRAKLRSAEVADDAVKLRDMILDGSETYATPGQAFNPLRPLLRSVGATPEGTVKISDLLAEVHKDPAAARAKYLNKSVRFEGLTQHLFAMQMGFLITFYPGQKPEAHYEQIELSLPPSTDSVLKGFKRGEVLRFDAVLTNARTITEEEKDLLDGGVKKTTRAMILLKLGTLYIEKSPL